MVATTGIISPTFPIGTALPAGVGATGQAVRQRRVVITADVLAEPGIAMPADLEGRLVAPNHRAACAVPLVVRGIEGAGELVRERGQGRDLLRLTARRLGLPDPRDPAMKIIHGLLLLGLLVMDGCATRMTREPSSERWNSRSCPKS